jgi:hypothetical protein
LCGRAFCGGSTITRRIKKKYPGAYEERLGLPDTQFAVENAKDHSYVAGNDEYPGAIMDTFMSPYNSQKTKQTDGEIPNLEFVDPLIPHEILFDPVGWRQQGVYLNEIL